MTKKASLMILFLAAISLMTSGCFSVEQEIFLQADGSGDMVMHLSLPDLPEELMKKSAAAGPGQPDPKQMIEEMKQKFSSGLPPTVQLKEVKEVKQNGAYGFYIVLHFNRLNDLEAALDSYSKEMGEKESKEKNKDESYWKVALEKKGDLTIVTQRLFIDLVGALGNSMPLSDKEKSEATSSDSITSPAPTTTPKVQPKPVAKRTGKQPARTHAPKERPAVKEESPEQDLPPDMFKELMGGEMMQMLFSMMFKFRFIVHAPKNFTETNADIVLNGNTAIWNASLGAFINEKNPKDRKVLEMKVVY